MPQAEPITLSWTLRLKYHKSTILLRVDPLQSLTALKEDLLHALGNLQSPLQNVSLQPTSASQIQLAKPRDMLDATAGWERIYVPDKLVDEVDELVADEEQTTKSRGKGKRKMNGSSDGSKRKGDDRTIKECGIKDNAVIAFRVAASPDNGGDQSLTDEEEDDWDVIIPTYEDTYGVENEGDLGQLKDYRG